ncbi:MAG: HpsJ family protein [Elainellaceae cyanobacterium]
MKELSSRQLSPVIATAFKVVGITMLLGTLFSIIFGPMPYAFGDREWLREFTTYIGERGFISLLGFSLFLAGFWIDSLVGSAGRLLPTLAVLLASVLSALYLLLMVFHISNGLAVRSEELEAIAERSAQAEQRIDTEIENQLGERRLLLNQLIENPELRPEAVSRGLISQENLAVLDQFEDDPEQLQTYLQGLDDQADTIRTEQQEQIKVTREENIREINIRTRSLNLRIGLLSLLWAIGHGALGWTGLRWFRYRD